MSTRVGSSESLDTACAMRRRGGSEGTAVEGPTSDRTWYGMSPLPTCVNDMLLGGSECGEGLSGLRAEIVVIIS